MTVIVDPAIRILPDGHRIFVLHPGEGKRFYTDFQATDSVFLDLPGIAFTNPPQINDEDLRNQLRMARRVSIWRRRGSNPDDKPSRNPDDYKITTVTPDAPRFVHEVYDLYTEAKAGDLIIVPGKGYGSTVFFGEAVNNFDPDFTVESLRYPDERIPARKVKWLPVNLAKQQFNRRLIRLMQNRQAIIQVTREDDRREIYTHAYGDYVWKESSGNLIRVTKDDIDLNDLNKAVDLTNYFASQYLALKKGELAAFFGLGFHEAIDSYYDKSYFGGVNVEIHSPGYFGRPMKKAAMAGYVSAMLALSGSGISAQEATDAKVVNSANAASAVVSICDMELEADIRQTMEMYANIHLWENDVCPRREATKNSVGLKTDVTVKKEVPAAGN
ncbi:hypothetical protein [Mesorhizobium sp. B1-1-5]|uniref:hypothetical protein n=1 Tax=Mesorhizobium sp. B1-1-5 TaxID=2589979 RepID=UPI00112995C4|nr:hypothetical protein [Mesorhizobium sp. B1-1-5]TPO02192.1 hypothetical protein FJ980_18725 [Mesorhizobium sp. B1-1-5]